MKLKNIFYISFKNFLKGRIRTALTITASAIGFGVLLSLISFGFGIQKITVDEMSNQDTMKIFDALPNQEENGLIDEKTISKIRNLEEVVHAEPTLYLPAQISFGTTSTPATIQGITNKYCKMANKKHINEGKTVEPKGNEAHVSTTLLKILSIKESDAIGKDLNITIKNNLEISEEIENQKEILTMNNIVISGIFEDPAPIMVMSIERIEEEIKIPGYNALKIQVTKEETVKEVIRKTEKFGFEIQYIGDTIKEINNIFVIFSLILGGFGAVALTVAVVGLINTLTVSLIERTKEIALLKSFGMKERGIVLLIITESVLINISGAFLGLILYGIITNLANQTFNYYAKINEGYQLDLFFAPIWLHPATILVAILIGIFAALFPTIRASRIPIIKAYKYE